MNDRDPEDATGLGLGGWLYADLMLVLFITALAALAASNTNRSQAPTPTVSVSQTPSASPRPTRTYTPTTRPTLESTSTVVQVAPQPTARPTALLAPTGTPMVSLSQVPITFTITANANILLGAEGPAKEQEREKIALQLGKLITSGVLPIDQRAGLVLTFGRAGVPTEGQRLALEMNRILQGRLPKIFKDSVMREFHFLNAATRGRIDVEVFLFTTTSGK